MGWDRCKLIQKPRHHVLKNTRIKTKQDLYKLTSRLYTPTRPGSRAFCLRSSGMKTTGWYYKVRWNWINETQRLWWFPYQSASGPRASILHSSCRQELPTSTSTQHFKLDQENALLYGLLLYWNIYIRPRRLISETACLESISLGYLMTRFSSSWWSTQSHSLQGGSCMVCTTEAYVHKAKKVQSLQAEPRSDIIHGTAPCLLATSNMSRKERQEV